jgi:HEPN domain-containing protein
MRGLFFLQATLFGKEDAREAIADASKVLKLCKKIFKEWKG